MRLLKPYYERAYYEDFVIKLAAEIEGSQGSVVARQKKRLRKILGIRRLDPRGPKFKRLLDDLISLLGQAINVSLGVKEAHFDLGRPVGLTTGG